MMGLHTHKTDLKNSRMSMLAKWMYVEESEGIDVDEEEEMEEDESELQAGQGVASEVDDISALEGGGSPWCL